MASSSGEASNALTEYPFNIDGRKVAGNMLRMKFLLFMRRC
jgi:hypothetical protein